MPSILYSSICLGGIPSLGISCFRAWNKVFQVLEQVIEGTPLFAPSKIMLFSFQLFWGRVLMASMTMTVMTVGVFIFLTVVLLVIYLLWLNKYIIINIIIGNTISSIPAWRWNKWGRCHRCHRHRLLKISIEIFATLINNTYFCKRRTHVSMKKA